jgi:hypothetical protein
MWLAYENVVGDWDFLKMAKRTGIDSWEIYHSVDDWQGTAVGVDLAFDNEGFWHLAHQEDDVSDGPGPAGRAVFKYTTNRMSMFGDPGTLAYEKDGNYFRIFDGAKWDTLVSKDTTDALRTRIEEDREVVSFAINADTLRSSTLYLVGELHSSASWNMVANEDIHATEQMGVARAFWTLGAAASASPCTVRVGPRTYDLDGGGTAGDWDTLYIDPNASADTTVFSDKYITGLFRFQDIGTGDTRVSNVGLINVWDNFGKPFTIRGLYAQWYSWDAETNLNIEIYRIRLNSNSGWSYSASSVDLPTPNRTSDQDFSNNPDSLVADDYHSWYRRNMNIAIDPTAGEGLLIRAVDLDVGEVPFLHGTLQLEIED